MKFEWLAALAYPRAIAVHPNFASQGQPTAPGKLASEILNDSRPLRKAEEDVVLDGEEFADRCIAALRENSSGVLADLESSANASELDLAQRACAGIVLAAVQLESGTPKRGLLDGIIRDAGQRSDSLARLTHLWLRLASAVIAMWYGDDKAGEIHEIRIELERWTAPREVELETTVGLDLSGEVVVTRIADLLAHAALRWEIDLERLGGDLWIQQLRRPTPLLLSGLQANVANGYSEWTKRTFQEAIARRTQVIGGTLLPGDTSMITAVLVSQFCFHPYSRHAAMELGRSRFLRGQSLAEGDVRTWAIHSACNLMRFSGQRESVKSAVQYTIRHGPLSALIADIEDVMAAIDTRGQATHLEIDYLTEAAPLLPIESARALFGLLAQELSGAKVPLAERWTAPWARRESVAKCLGSLSGPADMAADLIFLLAQQIDVDNTESDDRLLSQAVQAAPELPVAAASTLLTRISEVGGHALLREALAAQLGESVVAPVLPPNADERPLDAAVRYIDQVIRGEIRPMPERARQHGESVRTELEAIRANIGGGQTVGGVEALDVAVAYATVGGYLEIWPTVVDLLQEPRLIRSKKTSALRRIASSRSAVPNDVRQRLEESLPALLATEGSPFDEQGTPYPAALHVAAALNLVDDGRLLAMLGPLMSSSSPGNRLTAVTVLGNTPPDSRPSWVTQSLLTSTYDPDPDVQAEAVQALAYAYASAGPLQNLIAERINDLLARDGSWLLRKVLAELGGESATQLRALLAGRLNALAQHADWRVRRAAASLAG